MSDDIAIKVGSLSKCYQIYDTPRDRLKQFLLPRVQRMAGLPARQYYREFWALQDVSFEVKKGETVGIIGRNGSGKSTLLQIICGTLNPTSGSVYTDGRISALLELGSGFNPEFTGRENVYMNASVLGITKDEIDARFDDIAAFADIGEFIEQPVKIYSSGMMMRLAFAVAINVNPSILIIDEALSVGDIAFQDKCFRKIRQLKSSGVTILFVTHDVSTISAFCDAAVLIHNGDLAKIGDVNSVVNEYKKIISSFTFSAEINGDAGPQRISRRDPEYKNYYAISNNYHRSGDGSAEILDWYVASDVNAGPVHILKFEREYYLIIDLVSKRDGLNPNVGFFFSNEKGLEISGSAINHEGVFIENMNQGERARVIFRFLVTIKPGTYFLNLGVSEVTDNGVVAYDRQYSICEITVTGNKPVVGFLSLQPSIEVRRFHE